MIYVSQGHEKGIGLEVFLRGFQCLSKSFQSMFTLVCSNEVLNEHLKFIAFEVNQSKTSLSIGNSVLNLITFNRAVDVPDTMASLKYILESISEKDILLTLPSSKDQFFDNGTTYSGHTEYFRKYYNGHHIGMTFLAHNTNVMLLSDHISIDKVSNYITEELIVNKTTNCLKSFPHNRQIEEIYFTGINPHCGEDGLISSTDNIITSGINELRNRLRGIKVHDMLPGDTIHFHMTDVKQLFIYAFHDQGLAPFKLKYGLSGINFSTGMPFRRVSVDHGTSFDLYGKSTANYTGMLYLLNEIENWA